MGKRIVSQRRGKGSMRYRAPNHRFFGEANYTSVNSEQSKGVVRDIVHCPAHTAPLVCAEYENGELALLIAPEGIRVNDIIESNTESVAKGNIVRLKDVPEGTSVYNIEGIPGDGGKFVRSSGTTAKVVSQLGDKVEILLPSKKKKIFNLNCRATVGVIAAGGRPDKPFMKAGTRHYKMKARNKLYPKVCGVSMNAVDHPHGGAESHHKGKPTIARRYAPPGAKVGKIRPRRTGMKR